ncbi:MAG: hypothetical protein MZV64_52070 [Ignavibacteriales bacterium]|nr:hypothetical protein [Ignavibacteriales bacterium]
MIKLTLLVYAQKFLSTLKRTGEVFGLNYIIDVLLGNDTDRILSNNHHKLSVFGVGKELSKKAMADSFASVDKKRNCYS